MSHINYSPEFEAIRDLFKGIKSKHDADAATIAGSVLQQCLTEQGIDLVADLALVNQADAAHINFLQKQKLSEEILEQRRKLFGHPIINLRQCVQFLKKLKLGKVHELGAWGITVDGDNRITYPAEFNELKKVVKDFIAKHNSFPAGTSPLQPYLDEHPEIDLVQDLADVNAADAANNDYKAAVSDKEIFREERDVKMDLVQPHILKIGQFLMGLFNTRPHKLGAWGFEIDEANPKEKERALFITQASKQTVYKAVQDSLVTNKSSFAVNIYSGKGTDGTPILLGPDASFTVKFRFGTFTVENPNSTEKAKIIATTYHT